MLTRDRPFKIRFPPSHVAGSEPGSPEVVEWRLQVGPSVPPPSTFLLFYVSFPFYKLQTVRGGFIMKMDPFYCIQQGLQGLPV